MNIQQACKILVQNSHPLRKIFRRPQGTIFYSPCR